MGIVLDDDMYLCTTQFTDDHIICAGQKEHLEYMIPKLKEEQEFWGKSR